MRPGIIALAILMPGFASSARGQEFQPLVNGTDAAQCRVERLGHGEVAGDYFHVLRQHRGRRVTAGERADRHARGGELVDDGAPDPAGRSGDQHRKHPPRCHVDVGVS